MTRPAFESNRRQQPDPDARGPRRTHWNDTSRSEPYGPGRPGTVRDSKRGGSAIPETPWSRLMLAATLAATGVVGLMPRATCVPAGSRTRTSGFAEATVSSDRCTANRSPSAASKVNSAFWPGASITTSTRSRPAVIDPDTSAGTTNNATLIDPVAEYPGSRKPDNPPWSPEPCAQVRILPRASPRSRSGNAT
jgi:hypothetical protein